MIFLGYINFQKYSTISLKDAQNERVENTTASAVEEPTIQNNILFWQIDSQWCKNKHVSSDIIKCKLDASKEVVISIDKYI